MARGKINKNHLKIDSVKHKDKRKNIPTEELRDFVKEDENKPTIVTFPGQLYARDASFDPQHQAIHSKTRLMVESFSAKP